VIFLRSGGEWLVERNCVCIPSTGQASKFILNLFVAMACLLSRPAPGQTLQPNGEQKKVHGTVVSAVTHRPVGRALVYSSDNRFGMLTDGEGNFEFTLPKTESDASAAASGPVAASNSEPWLWLMARKPGYVDDPADRRHVRASPGTEFTLSLVPEAVIKGRVTLSTNESAAGANVQIFSRQVQEGTPRWMPREAVRANSNGEFRFAELAAGSYKIVTHELMDNDPVTRVPNGPLFGFPPVYYPATTDFAAANTIQVTAGQTVQADISLVRHPYYLVTIPIANAEANPGMNITVSLQGNHSPGYSLGYNAGRQRIEGSLPNGNYVVEATTFGPAAATGMVNLAVAGAATEGHSLVLSRNSSIAVNVKEGFTASWNGSASWSDGRHTFNLHGPRMYLQISAEAADDFVHTGASLRQPSGPNDPLILEDLPPGRYWLRLHTSRGYVASATMGSIDLFHQPFVVGSGSASIEITMRDDGAEVEGTVAGVSASGTQEQNNFENLMPAAHIYWVPFPDSSGQFAEGAASADGKFTSQTIAPGTYRVLAFKERQPNFPYRDAEAMRAYETKGQVVHLPAGQKANIQLQLIPSE
jgi:Carboxypeptidase regulatory-like domain